MTILERAKLAVSVHLVPCVVKGRPRVACAKCGAVLHKDGEGHHEGHRPDCAVAQLEADYIRVERRLAKEKRPC